MSVWGIIGIILLCILAVPVFLVLLAVFVCSFKTRVRVKVTPEEKELWISHLFWKKRIFPRPPKKEKKPEKDKKDEEEDDGEPEEKKKGVGDAVKSKLKALTLPDHIDFIGMLKDGFIDRIMFEKLHLQIKVGTPSADLTAQRYGQLTAAVFPLLGRLDAAGKIKDGRVNISPDFLSEEILVLADVDVSFRIVHLLSWAIKVVFKVIKK